MGFPSTREKLKNLEWPSKSKAKCQPSSGDLLFSHKGENQRDVRKKERGNVCMLNMCMCQTNYETLKIIMIAQSP